MRIFTSKWKGTIVTYIIKSSTGGGGGGVLVTEQQPSPGEGLGSIPSTSKPRGQKTQTKERWSHRLSKDHRACCASTVYLIVILRAFLALPPRLTVTQKESP